MLVDRRGLGELVVDLTVEELTVYPVLVVLPSVVVLQAVLV